MVYIDTCYEINDELPKKKTQKENRSAVESAEKWVGCCSKGMHFNSALLC